MRTEQTPPAVSNPRNADRVARGFIMLTLNACIGMAGQLSIVPIAMLGWGQTRYGEWITLTGLITFLKLSDLGVQTYVVNKMGAAYARNEVGEIKASLESALRLQLPIMAALFVIISMTFGTLPIADWLRLHTIGEHQLRLLGVAMSVELLIAIPMGVVTGIYRATGRLARGAFTGIVQAIGQLAITMLLIWRGETFLTVILARLVVTIGIYLWIVRDLHGIYPWFRLSVGHGSWREGFAMLAPSALFLVFPLSDFLASQAGTVMLQRVNSGAEVSRLATHRTAVNAAQMVGNLLVNTAWPELTRLHAQRVGGLQDVLRSLIKLHLWIVSGLSIAMIPLLPHVYASWTVGRMQIDPWTLGLLISRMVLWSFWYPSMTILLATNRHHTASIAIAVSALVTTLASLLLVPLFGLRGAAGAPLVGDVAVVSWIVPWLAHREYKTGLTKTLTQTLNVLVLAIMLPSLAAIALWHLSTDFPSKYLSITAIGILMSMGGMWASLENPERTFVIGVVRRLWAGRFTYRGARTQ